MCIFLARCWILHHHLFVNGYVEENSSVGTDRLLQSRINPTVHVMAWQLQLHLLLQYRLEMELPQQGLLQVQQWLGLEEPLESVLDQNQLSNL